MNRYTKLKEKIQKEVNDFPIEFAFSEDQLQEGLKKMGVRREDVFAIGAGGFMRKTDKERFKAMFARHENEMKEACREDRFLIEALCYELGNYEYCITYDPTEALNVLGVSLKDERVKRCFDIARKEYLASAAAA